MKRSRSLRIARRLDGLLLGGALLLGVPALAQSTDPEIKKLEERTAILEKELARQQQRFAVIEKELARQQQRTAAAERELDLLAGDAKGKDFSSFPDPPAFARASNNVQSLSLRGELRLRYEYDDLGAQANNPRNPVNGSVDNLSTAQTIQVDLTTKF